MHKKILILFFSLISGIIFSMDQNPSDHLAKEKAKVVKEIQKNTAQLQLIKKTLSGGFSKIESHLNKVISSPEFQSIIEAMTTKQAQEIAQGKTFDEVKYNHSLPSEFPNLANKLNKFLTFAYSVMANIAHYQLLLSKLNTVKESESMQAPVTTASDITKTITP